MTSGGSSSTCRRSCELLHLGCAYARPSRDHVLSSAAVDVATPQPSVLRQDWWIASCDGAVAVPEWHSIYLPTFGGLVRYDVTDETHPAPIAGSYRAAGGLTDEAARAHRHAERPRPHPRGEAPSPAVDR